MFKKIFLAKQKIEEKIVSISNVILLFLLKKRACFYIWISNDVLLFLFQKKYVSKKQVIRIETEKQSKNNTKRALLCKSSNS